MLEKAYEFADRSRIFRRLVLYSGLGINFYAFHWAINYAVLTAGMPHMATAAIIAAILTPATGLLAAVFKFYNEGRSNDNASR